MADDDTRRLLEDIRDTQREHLAEYRRVTQQSLELQRQAVDRQDQMAGMYRRVVLLGGVLGMALVALLIALLIRWGSRLF